MTAGLTSHQPVQGSAKESRLELSALRTVHFTVTVKQPVRSSFVGLVKLSTSRNMTSNCVPSTIVGDAKSMCTAPEPPFEVCKVTSGPVAGSGNVTKLGAGGPQGGRPAARWQIPSAPSA